MRTGKLGRRAAHWLRLCGALTGIVYALQASPAGAQSRPPQGSSAAARGTQISKDDCQLLRNTGGCSMGCDKPLELIQCGTASIGRACRELRAKAALYKAAGAPGEKVLADLAAQVDKCVAAADTFSGKGSWKLALTARRAAQTLADRLGDTTLFTKTAPGDAPSTPGGGPVGSGDPAKDLREMESTCREQRRLLGTIRTQTDRTTGQVIYNRLEPAHRANVDAAIRDAETPLRHCEQIVRNKQSAAVGAAHEAVAAVQRALATLAGKERRDGDERERKKQEEINILLAEYKRLIADYVARHDPVRAELRDMNLKWDKLKDCGGIPTPGMFGESEYRSCGLYAIEHKATLEVIRSGKAAPGSKFNRADAEDCLARAKALVLIRRPQLANAIESSRSIWSKVKKAGCDALGAVAEAGNAIGRFVKKAARDLIEGKVKPILKNYVRGQLATVRDKTPNQIHTTIRDLIKKGVNAALKWALSGPKALLIGEVCGLATSMCAAAGAPAAGVGGLVSGAACAAGCTALASSALDKVQEALVGVLIDFVYGKLKHLIDGPVEDLLRAVESV